METVTGTYIQWKNEHYDQNVIKVSTFATPQLEEIPRLTASLPS